MVLSSRQRRQRSGIILLVVLALITLFASIGVAFVYFSEQEVTKAADQKAGETIKLPDADLLFNYVMRQIIFPTNNNNSALFTHSLLENMYGKSNPGVGNINAYNGTGRRAYLYRDPNAGVRDLQIPPAGTFGTVPSLVGQDELYRPNFQTHPGVPVRPYNEALHGSLNPTYTYPDHKNPYLGAVAANYTTRNFPYVAPATYTEHGPVAIARSFAREIKLRVAVIDPSIVDPLVSNVVRYHEVVFNPYSNDSSSDYWTLINDPTIIYPGGMSAQTHYVKRIPPLPSIAPLVYSATPGIAANSPAVPVPGTPAIQTTATGNIAFIVMDRASCLAHTLRPNPRLNPQFPPPGDLGGDVKNLPPEVKTLVGFNGTTPVFANNDSYWMNIGFPAIPYSNNRKVIPLAAVFIMDNDGKVNLNVAGNLRGRDIPATASPATTHLSGHGMGPYEINPLKMYPSAVPAANRLDELRKLIAGAQVGSSFIRGRAGITPGTPDVNAGDPTTTSIGNPAPIRGYLPILRGAPYYAPYNLDGGNDNFSVPGWLWSDRVAISGDDPNYPNTLRGYLRSPVFSNGFLSGGPQEYSRLGFSRSPLFLSPFAFSQVSPIAPLTGNEYSVGGISHQRRFGFHNQEALYRQADTGADKIDSELRKLVPYLFLTPQQRWQLTTISNDLNVAGIAPWKDNTADYLVNRTPAIPPALDLDTNLSRGAGAAVQLPAAPPSNGEYSPTANYLWRSIFGNRNRIDLSRQLPDYPEAADNNSHLVMTDPIVRSRYMIALQARQKLAHEIYTSLVNLVHPDTTTVNNTSRWLAQLAVNIVDYIDNDDYPTWFKIETGPNNAETIVWGTELPRLVINEVYAEAVNDPADPLPMNQAQNPYNVKHWVELYNPLMNSTFPGVWRDGANARLHVNNTSVYRLLITPQTNITHMRSAAPTYTPNNMGYPDDILATHTVQVTFETATAANTTVEPSHDNYGTGQQPTVPNPNPGFYLIGPGSQPLGTAANAPAGPDFPASNYDDPRMEITGRIPQTAGRFQDTAGNRQVILLQRLANPYLPHNPVPPPTPAPGSISNMLLAGEMPDATLPYNPYITIDYAANISPNHAVERDSNGAADNQNLDPATGTLQAGVQYRSSIGKMQPYAAINDAAGPGAPLPESLWLPQRPDENKTTAGHQAMTNQIQHTFMRHNAVEGVFPLTDPFMNPLPNANGLLPYNTLKLPFDWLRHLDRAPTSPADLLEVSGYRPHELTQQFNRVSTVTAATFPTTLTAAATVNFTGPFINQLHGTPYTLKNGDLLEIVYTISDGMTTTDRTERVLAQGVNLLASPPSFNATTTLTTMPGETVTSARIRQIVPFAHHAPWHRSLQNINIQSSNRLYRLLEGVAVRNPGVHVGQYRFTSGVLPTNSNNIYRINTTDGTPIGDTIHDNSVWIQLDNGVTATPGFGVPNHASTHSISTNDALVALSGAGNPLQDPSRATINTFNQVNVGDTVVIRDVALTFEERAMVLEVDYVNNRIRTVLSNMPTPGNSANNPLTIDFTYVAGRQPGRINLNTMWDVETFRALADAQPMNQFRYVPNTITPPPPYFNDAGDNNVDQVYRRIVQQRQPGYFHSNRLVGHTGINNPGSVVIPEDRPFQGMGIGDIAANREVPVQGIGNTYLSDRYQTGTTAIPGEETDPHRFSRSLFEVGVPGIDHPQRRFEMLNKVWNNSTVRSNTFSVWITIGFFEYNEADNSIGAEIGQIQGKNTRHRFFAVVDRSSIDSWLRSWNLHDVNANINLLADTSLFPSLDPRQETYPQLNPAIPNNTAISLPGNYARTAGTFLNLPTNGLGLPGIWTVNVSGSNPFFPSTPNRLVHVESAAGLETAQIVDAPNASTLRLKLTINHTGLLTIRPLPVPPTVLHWSQIK
jgi:hypothetical protein